MNLVLEKSEQMPFHTDMRLVCNALPGVVERYDWLISDIDCQFFCECLPDIWRWDDPLMIAGKDLKLVLENHEIQFVWAVFSALPVGVVIVGGPVPGRVTR